MKIDEKSTKNRLIDETMMHAGHKTGLMCTTVYLWGHNHLFCIRSGLMAKTFFCVACILVEVVWSYRNLFIAVFEYQLAVGLINPNYNSNSRLVPFESVFPPMAYECRTSSSFKTRKIKKISTEKPYLTRASNPEPLG
jgi:hypothetical protein